MTLARNKTNPATIINTKHPPLVMIHTTPTRGVSVRQVKVTRGNQRPAIQIKMQYLKRRPILQNWAALEATIDPSDETGNFFANAGAT